MSVPKYHHKVPQTYLRAWCYSNNSIYVIDKEKNEIETKRIDNNFGVTQFHAITAGMQICEMSDLEIIFKSLDGFEVFYNGSKLNSLTDYNYQYSNFDSWVIKKNGIEISQKQRNIINAEIKKVKITEIETLWSTKYESRWPDTRDIIEQNVLSANSNIIDEFYKGLIMRFVVAFNWRGFYGNESFKSTYKSISDLVKLDEINIPFEDRQKQFLETAADEIEHLLLLKKYREFLSETGIIYEIVKTYIRHMGIRFYVANGKKKFITSDNPSFFGTNPDGLIVHMMPVSPKIIICIGRDNDGVKKYYVDRVSDNAVDRINKQIFDNSIERIITLNEK